MSNQPDLNSRYDAAVEAFVEKVRQDPYILAAVLVGSLANDVVWRKSDIDIALIADEVKLHEESFSLVEDGLDIHAFILTRSAFKRLVEGNLQSSFFHSMLERGRFLFTRDETLRELWSRGERVGSRDRGLQLLRYVSQVLPALTKAEKWLEVKHDPDYCFHWLQKCVDSLAILEVLQHGEIAGREAINHALRLNPAFFRAVYTDLIRGEKSEAVLAERIALIRAYILERVPLFFGPLLLYLAEAGVPRSSSELSHHFCKQHNLESVDTACEWLAEEGILGKASAPRRLTPKSRVDVQEAAYYYDGEVTL